MGRPTEQKAEYFPHYVGGGKTLRALERAYGNDGYAFWFKLLETLCSTDGHCLDLSNDIELIDLAGYVRKDEAEVIEMIDYLVRLGQVDRALWETDRRVWIQGLIDKLSPLYAKRTDGAPRKPCKRGVSDAETDDQASFRDGNADEDSNTEQSDAETPQRKEEKSIEEECCGSSAPAREEKPAVIPAVVYCEQNLMFMSSGNKNDLREFLADGVTEEVVRYAVDEACSYGGRTWGYVRSTLNKWIVAGVRTVGDARAYDDRHRGGGGPQAPPSRGAQKTGTSKSKRFLEIAQELEAKEAMNRDTG